MEFHKPCKTLSYCRRLKVFVSELQVARGALNAWMVKLLLQAAQIDRISYHMNATRMAEDVWMAVKAGQKRHIA